MQHVAVTKYMVFYVVFVDFYVVPLRGNLAYDFYTNCIFVTFILDPFETAMCDFVTHMFLFTSELKSCLNTRATFSHSSKIQCFFCVVFEIPCE